MAVKEKIVYATKHSFLRFLSVASVALVLLGIGWAVYVMAIKPHTNPTPTTTQQAQAISNYNITETEDAFFVGIKIFGLKLGIMKPVKAKKPVITQKEGK